MLALGLCAHAYGSYFMGEREAWFDRMRARFRLEHGLLAGGAIAGAGALIAAVIVLTWIQRGFGVLAEERLAGRGLRADHRRRPGPVLVIPALDPRAAAPRRRDGVGLGARAGDVHDADQALRVHQVDAELAPAVEQHLEAGRRAGLDRLELPGVLDLDAVEQVARAR